MQLGNEYRTSNTGIAFPFRENASGISYSGTEHGPNARISPRIFVDALAFVPPNVQELYLQEIAHTGSTHELFFVDTYGNPVISVQLSDAELDAHDLYMTGTWHFPALPVTLKLVISVPDFVDYAASFTGLDSFGFSLGLEHTVLNIKSPTVDSFEIYEEMPVIPAPHTPGPINGRVQLFSGYNINTRHDPSEEFDTSEITIAAAPTTGEGLAPCQEGLVDFYRGLQELVPDEDGDVKMLGGPEGCYSIVPFENILSIHSSCRACCSCEDYENTAKAIHELLMRSQATLETLKNAHVNYYNPGVQHYNSIVANRYINPVFEVNGMAGAEWSEDSRVRSGSPGWVTIVAALKNNTAYRLQPLRLGANIQPNPIIRQLAWEYGGVSNQWALPVTLNSLLLTHLPVVERGQQLTIYALGRVGFDMQPHWAGTLSMQVRSVPFEDENPEEHEEKRWTVRDSFEAG